MGPGDRVRWRWAFLRAAGLLHGAPPPPTFTGPEARGVVERIHRDRWGVWARVRWACGLVRESLLDRLEEDR